MVDVRLHARHSFTKVFALSSFHSKPAFATHLLCLDIWPFGVSFGTWSMMAPFKVCVDDTQPGMKFSKAADPEDHKKY